MSGADIDRLVEGLGASTTRPHPNGKCADLDCTCHGGPRAEPNAMHATGQGTKVLDPKALQPGTTLIYRNGRGSVVLSHRKDDDSGWWNLDDSGLDDRVIAESRDWTVSEAPVASVRSAVERLFEHADYLDRQGRRTLAADLRGVLEALGSLTVLAEAHVSGQAMVSAEAIAIAGRKFMEAPTHGR